MTGKTTAAVGAAAAALLACFVFLAGPHSSALAAADLTAEEIIARVDANTFRQSAYSRSTMVIRQERRQLVKEMHIWADEDSNAFVEFVNPADRGTKYLKLGDELWMFFPDADDLVRISGHMLRQGFMGSDFSYEDTLESDTLGDRYRFTLEGTEPCADGEAMCYVLEAVALPDVKVTYARRRLWVDTDLFVVRQQELYAAGGRLLKVARVDDIQLIDGRYVGTRVTMRDVLRRDSETTVIVDHLELDVDIPEGMFTLQHLMR